MALMAVYTVATKTTETIGHGNSLTKWVVEREGAYCDGEYPPLFFSEEAAQAWLDKNPHYGDRKIIELHFD